MIVFGFWISHVPEALGGLLTVVGARLAPGDGWGAEDNAEDGHVERHGPPEVQGPIGDGAHPGLGERKPRVLRDGRTFTIVKRYWTPASFESNWPS